MKHTQIHIHTYTHSHVDIYIWLKLMTKPLWLRWQRGKKVLISKTRDTIMKYMYNIEYINYANIHNTNCPIMLNVQLIHSNIPPHNIKKLNIKGVIMMRTGLCTSWLFNGRIPRCQCLAFCWHFNVYTSTIYGSKCPSHLQQQCWIYYSSKFTTTSNRNTNGKVKLKTTK